MFLDFLLCHEAGLFELLGFESIYFGFVGLLLQPVVELEGLFPKEGDLFFQIGDSVVLAHFLLMGIGFAFDFAELYLDFPDVVLVGH